MEKPLKRNDFYNWAYSDLLVNNQRGHLAEFIVAKALNIDSQKRLEWEPYDLKYNDIKIEVKSCSYIQAWQQKQYSKISFDIAPTRLYDYENECYSDECKRQSDIYVFCLLKHKDRETINPLDLEQWDFYITTTTFLNLHFTNQKQIALSKLTKNNVVPVKYNQIKSFIDNLERAR